mmetsp:Transcript_65610/g.182485  ORF Transcript_65610/g.182485 Transcript_65610/m.182485 type:complete len:206 (+) Transcript_65610:1515-2132(+)
MRAPCTWAQAWSSENLSNKTRRGPSVAILTAFGESSCRKSTTIWRTAASASPGMSEAHALSMAQTRTGSSKLAQVACFPICGTSATIGVMKLSSCWNPTWGFKTGWQRLKSNSTVSFRHATSKVSAICGGWFASSLVLLAMCSTNCASSGACWRARIQASPTQCSSVCVVGPDNWSSGSASQSWTSSAESRSAVQQHTSQSEPVL